jgi:hypothetical protein
MVWDAECAYEDEPKYRDNGEEMTEMPIVSNVTLIKKFFEMGGRKVEMAEMKALTIEDREELGKMAREVLEKMETK